jgi:hypothetical protein
MITTWDEGDKFITIGKVGNIITPYFTATCLKLSRFLSHRHAFGRIKLCSFSHSCVSLDQTFSLLNSRSCHVCFPRQSCSREAKQFSLFLKLTCLLYLDRFLSCIHTPTIAIFSIFSLIPPRYLAFFAMQNRTTERRSGRISSRPRYSTCYLSCLAHRIVAKRHEIGTHSSQLFKKEANFPHSLPRLDFLPDYRESNYVIVDGHPLVFWR